MKFKDILSQLGIPTAPAGHHHCRPGWIQIDCPYCGYNSNRWHLGYSIEGNYLNCWRCGGHSLASALMTITRRSYYEINKLLTGLEPSLIKKVKPTGELIIPKNVGGLRDTHIRYLNRRGFDYRTLERLWSIQGIGISGRLAWRIFIPIIYHSKIVSWTTRTISDKEYITRYISAGENEESMPHHELLYGEDYARHAIIIEEGITDVWMTGPGAVCTFGLGYSTKQLERMASYPTRAVCFDNEYEAQKRAERLSNDLSVFPGDTYNVVLDAKDAGESSMEEIQKLRKEILE